MKISSQAQNTQSTKAHKAFGTKHFISVNMSIISVFQGIVLISIIAVGIIFIAAKVEIRLSKPNIKKLWNKGDVKGLIMALKYGDTDIRIEAAWTLGKIGSIEANWTLGTIQSQTTEALCILSRIFRNREDGRDITTRLIESLIEALKDGNHYVRIEASWALSRIGEPAVESLIKALKDENWYVRRGAAETLDKLKRKLC